jgi:hypothetical protein
VELSLWYWLLMFLSLLSSFYYGYQTPPAGRFSVGGWSLVIWLLFLVIGLRLFGSPVK